MRPSVGLALPNHRHTNKTGEDVASRLYYRLTFRNTFEKVDRIEIDDCGLLRRRLMPGHGLAAHDAGATLVAPRPLDGQLAALGHQCERV